VQNYVDSFRCFRVNFDYYKRDIEVKGTESSKNKTSRNYCAFNCTDTSMENLRDRQGHNLKKSKCDVLSRKVYTVDKIAPRKVIN